MSIQNEIPKSRLTLRYKTEVKGVPEDIHLPLRILVLGDFSGRDTEKVDFEDREIHTLDGRNINAVMESMKLRLSVPDGPNDKKNIAITKLEAFSPNELVGQIDYLGMLQNGRERLSAVLSILRNNKKFKKSFSAPLSLEEIEKSVSELKTNPYLQVYEEEAKIGQLLPSTPDA